MSPTPHTLPSDATASSAPAGDARTAVKDTPATPEVTIAGVVGTAVLVAWSAVRHRGGTTTPIGRFSTSIPLPVTAWATVSIVTFVPVLLTAQHRSGGGSPYPRYLLPMVPVVATAIALAAVRFGTRWLGLALVALLAAVAFRQTRASATWLADNLDGPPGSELVTAYGNELVRGACLAVAAVGLVDGEVVSLGQHRVYVYPDTVTSLTFKGLRPYQ